MTSEARYTPYHPKWYRRPVSVWWWLESWRFTRFVLRELTSLPVAFFAFVLLAQIAAVVAGPQAYERFLARTESPVFIVLHLLCLGAVLFHAITWFHLAPRAMVVRLGKKRVSDRTIVVSNYAGWIAATVAVAWLWLR